MIDNAKWQVLAELLFGEYVQAGSGKKDGWRLVAWEGTIHVATRLPKRALEWSSGTLRNQPGNTAPR